MNLDLIISERNHLAPSNAQVLHSEPKHGFVEIHRVWLYYGHSATNQNQGINDKKIGPGSG